MPERLPLRRRLAYGSIAVAMALVLAGAGVLGADLYLHHKYERVSVFNVWGYRGPAIGARAPGEFRTVVLGGSAAFGYGLLWDEAFPYFLEQRLNATASSRRFSVVNLAFNNEAAASFLPTLEDYRYLDYDLAILYEGYNDLIARPRDDVFRRQSKVFNLTGYLPILPMVLKEKFFDLRYAGDIGRGYRRDGGEAQTVFRPGAADRSAASVRSLDRQLGGLTAGLEATAVPDPDCGEAWAHYCAKVEEAVRFARRRDVLVIVATQPYISDAHVEQQAAVGRALRAHFNGDAGVATLNLGRAIDLQDAALAYDGMHLTAAGNRILAEAFVNPVLELASRAPVREGR